MRIAGCFLGVGLVPGVAGALLGVPGAMAFASILTKASTDITGFPDPIMRCDARWLALAAASSIGVGLVSTLPPAYLVLRLRPSLALRGAGEVIFVGLPGLVERLLRGRPSVRYSVRNVFRRLPLTLATAVLVALAVALPAGLLTSISSWDSWATDQARILGWDAIASFKAPLSRAHVEELVADKGVGGWDGYVQGYAPMRREDGVVEEVRVRGIPLGSDLIRFHLTAGRVFTSDDVDEAILNSGFSSDRPVRLGEVVTLTKNGVTKKLRVVGLLTDATLSTVILPRATAQRFLELEDKYSGIYLRYGTPPAKTAAPAPLTEPTNRAPNAEAVEKLDGFDEPAAAIVKSVKPAFKDTKTALLDDDLVTAVQVRTEFAEANQRYLAAFNIVIVPFVGLSGVLAFFFLVSVLGFLFLERKAEYATLRSMGYGTAEIARIVFTEVAVLGAAGLVLSLGTWALTAYALREPMARTWFFVPLDFRATDFFTCSLPTILFLGLAALPGIRSLLRVDLSAALRGRSLG
jgi:ABC-type antimicrobial peptide transport system permease subunit